MDKYFIITNIILFMIIFFMINYNWLYKKKEIIIFKEITKPYDLQKGLMFHKQKLPPRTGLLFNYGITKNVNFWMKNTYIPLDIIGLDENRKIVELVEEMVPLDTNLTLLRNIKYAIEVNAGTIKEMNLKKGEQIKLIKEKKR
jgi:uncharacterized protein